MNKLDVLKKVAKCVRLVLCGTGLDLVDNESKDGVGSDRRKYDIIKMNGVVTKVLEGAMEDKDN